ncbi:pentatricopeptide repeat-containing protein At1g63400-like [Telopea speciosissima]|uniref:pentatricopeptide repeat-containing protein At1g63400-like n=1 Tax=Telopea speciosissima TaxID=54955 RepID=UPI001CC44002|nr:pentatricopeptide repeat-containing protein At1g63400-like [Telopea speciosissima]
MQNQGHEPDVITYTALISGFGKSRRIDEAIFPFREMRCKQLMPNNITYSTPIGGVCRWAELDGVTYNIMVEGLLKSNEILTVIQLNEIAEDRFLADSKIASMISDLIAVCGKDHECYEM